MLFILFFLVNYKDNDSKDDDLISINDDEDEINHDLLFLNANGENDSDEVEIKVDDDDNEEEEYLKDGNEREEIIVEQCNTRSKKNVDDIVKFDKNNQICFSQSNNKRLQRSHTVNSDSCGSDVKEIKQSNS